MTGRGRPKRADKYGGHISAAEQRIADRLPELIDNLFALAGGVKVAEETAEGAEIVYLKPPDRQANEYLLNRIMGKPTERHEHDHEFAALSDEELIALATGCDRGAGAEGADGPEPGA